jgi:hypothetical protein
MTFFNVVLFFSWSVDHSFWTYYLLVPIAFGWAEIFSKLARVPLGRTVSVIWFFFHFPHWSDSFATRAQIKTLEEKCPELLRQDQRRLFTDTDASLYGHGYAARWYLDRKATVIPLDALKDPGMKNSIFISTHPTQVDGVELISVCQYGNIWIYRVP